MQKGIRRCFEFDITGILMKLCYFCVHGKQGAIAPYLTVFLTSTGLDLHEASLISGLQFVPSIVFTQIFAFIADLTGRKSLVFATVAFIATIVIFPMPWFATMANISYSTLNVSQNNTIGVEHTMLYGNNIFYVMLVAVTIGFSFSNSLNGFVDSFVMNIIKSFPKKYDYGKQRLFGVLGFGLLNFIASMVSELDIISSSSQYLGVFITFLPAMLLLLPVGVILEQKASNCIEEDTTPDEEKQSSQKMLPKIFKLFLDMNNFMFFMSFLVAGICYTAVVGFLFKLMSDELNASKTIIGISTLVASLADIVLLVTSSKILSLVQDPINGVIISIFFYALRFILVAHLTNPCYIIITQILNAPTFSLVWASGVEHTKQICPSEITVSVFSILNNVFFNFGGLIGYWGGGTIYSAYGSKDFFLRMAFFAGGWFLIMVVYFKIFLCLPTVSSPGSQRKNAESSINVDVESSNAFIRSTM